MPGALFSFRLQRLAQGGEAASEKAAWRKGHQIPSAVSTGVRVDKKEVNSDQRVGRSVVSEMQTPCFLSLGQIRAIGRATVYLMVCTGLGQSTQKGGRAEGEPEDKEGGRKREGGGEGEGG